MSPPGYQAPVVKSCWCGNERQEMSDKRKVGRKGSGKNTACRTIAPGGNGGMRGSMGKKPAFVTNLK